MEQSGVTLFRRSKRENVFRCFFESPQCFLVFPFTHQGKINHAASAHQQRPAQGTSCLVERRNRFRSNSRQRDSKERHGGRSRTQPFEGFSQHSPRL